MIINSSSFEYKKTHFNNRVIDVQWMDHNACEFKSLIEIILECAMFLA